MGNGNQGKFETKTFTLCDECVEVKTTVEEMIGSVIVTGVTRYEVKMSVHDLLGEFLGEDEHRELMAKVEEYI